MSVGLGAAWTVDAPGQGDHTDQVQTGDLEHRGDGRAGEGEQQGEDGEDRKDRERQSRLPLESGGSVVFKNHSFEAFLLFKEIPTTAQTLHIDCSAAGIKMEEGKKIFDGSTINIHWFMLPPPGYNTSVMVALELLHPE